MTDSDLIKRYLLEELPEEERIRLEDEYFSDTGRFGELTAEEDDLIDSYIRGELSDSEQQHFARLYLNSPERRSRVDFARTLKDFIDLQTKSSPPKSASRWWSLGGFIDGAHGWPRFAFAAGLVVVVACGTWLLTENHRLRTELNQTKAARAELQRSRDSLAQQIANLSKPAPESAPGTGRGPEIAQVELPPLPGESLTLSPGMVRSGEQKVPTISLPLHGPSVRLQLLLAQEDGEHGAFEAAVRSAEGQEPIFTMKGLRTTRGADGTIVLLRVPSSLIQPDDYTVTLYNSGSDLSGAGIGSYVFRARLP
jgi:hypothetical protein